jgi:hypothetical protein
MATTLERPRGPERRTIQNRPEDDDEVFPDGGTSTKSRIVDWVQAFTFPFEIVIATFLGLILAPVTIAGFGNSRFIAACLVVIFVLAVLAFIGALWSQFAGTVFDADNDKLTFPTYSIRRTVPLSEIRDANSEFVYGGTILGRIMGNMARALNRQHTAKPSRMYVVNLSGPFGSRQVRFLSKRRRDQFLSLLRRYAPQARITRFAAWS